MKINPENFKSEVISEADLEGKQGIVYDIEAGESELPDINMVLDKVAEILEVCGQKDMIELKKKDSELYEKTMEDKFPEFSDRYYALFQQLLTGNDITPLLRMLVEIEKVQKSEQTLEEAEKMVGQSLADKYIYPNFKK